MTPISSPSAMIVSMKSNMINNKKNNNNKIFEIIN